MNLKIENLFNLFKKYKKNGCPNCFEKNIIGFGIDYLKSNFISSIKLTDEIGKIKIYQCEKCKAQFYIQGNMYEKIIDGQIELLKEWSKRNLVCPNDLKIEIEKIGLTNNWSLDKIVPCKVELNNGKKYEYTTIIFSDKPPLGHHYSIYKNIFFIDDIKHISESEYGISLEIRRQAVKSEEQSMGFYPTVLKNRDGKKVVLNGISIFFNSSNIKGSELELANEEWNYRVEYTYDTNNYSEKTIVIAKK
ncbi:hypothetical protein [Pedobacter montanisoli]|uniref:Uncharacterized protein n=1 Tax=Pedobacter montanisoli TaxID=2923277 RepID=A0ABS9ZWP5_9SPHI|nr:hypothetical protein [Pedobacter montanisoli]MCJ0742707.1 hypothetical protein [Pedobacter montanisoli]